MRFADLRSAGRQLGTSLVRYAGQDDVVILAIVRGGVPVAAEVAALLGQPLDLLLLRQLVQRADGSAARALRVAGTLVIDDEVAQVAPESGAGRYVAAALDQFAARELLCRGARPSRDLAGATVLLVDNGMRTGGTMRAAIGAVRALGASRIVAAVPVAAPAARDLIGPLADDSICLAWPEPFGHVGMFYERFEVPPDPAIEPFLSVQSHP